MRIIKIHLLVFVWAANVFAQDKPMIIDQYLTEMYAAHEPGAAVVVMKEWETISEKGYRLANLDSKQPVTPGLIFRISSITKQFTAAATEFQVIDYPGATETPLR